MCLNKENLKIKISIIKKANNIKKALKDLFKIEQRLIKLLIKISKLHNSKTFTYKIIKLKTICNKLITKITTIKYGATKKL